MSRGTYKPQWERDYILKPFGRYDIMRQYTEIILRHGYVLFFTAVCPFTPIFTLVVNILEMRLYSYAYTNLYRRPIPRKVEGIEIWFYILKCLTWIGVTVNALLALMAKDFPMMVYYIYTVDKNVTGYMDKKFAAFSLKDYNRTYFNDNITTCYFMGYRYPPDHPKKYQENVDLRKYHAFGWALVIMYLHVAYVLTIIIGYFIPDTSSEVKDYLNSLNEENQRELRKFRSQQFRSQMRQARSVVSIEPPRASGP